VAPRAVDEPEGHDRADARRDEDPRQEAAVEPAPYRSDAESMVFVVSLGQPSWLFPFSLARRRAVSRSAREGLLRCLGPTR
jgi:hypothetical protein